MQYVLLLQSDAQKKEEDSVEPVPQICNFVIDDLRKYVTNVIIIII